jgi:ribonuclease HI
MRRNSSPFYSFEVPVMGKLTIFASLLLLSYNASINLAVADDGAKSHAAAGPKTAAGGVDSWALPVKVEQKDGAEFCSINDPLQKSPVKFACTNHHPNCAEAEAVIQTLETYAKAYVSQDYKTCAEYMTEGITTFDERSKKLIVGKEAVLADMKARLDRSAPDSDSPLLSYTIDNPVAQVTGTSACVSCIGIKVYGGKHPKTVESHSSYVFVKEDGRWKKNHFRTDWKQVDTPKS